MSANTAMPEWIDLSVFFVEQSYTNNEMFRERSWLNPERKRQRPSRHNPTVPR
jgi:hypothetical protein